MKDLNYFIKSYNELFYPKRDNFTTVYFYSNGKVIQSILKSDEKYSKVFQDLSYAVFESIFDKISFDKEISIYQKKLKDLELEFKDWLKEEFDCKDNPKFEKCYSLAYEKEHSNGIYAIYDEFCDLVDLIK